MDPFKIPLERLEAAILVLKPHLVDAIGKEGLKFIDDNFKLQRYQGGKKWDKLKNPPKGKSRAILVNTGTLRRSFIKTDSANFTIISTDVPYARPHNEGFKAPQYVRSRMGTNGKIFTRNQNLPQRQFMPLPGENNPILRKNCERAVLMILTNALKQQL